MEIQNYLNEMKLFYQELLTFFDDDSNYDENYQNLIQIFKNQKIPENIHKLKTVLHIFSKMTNNHFRTPLFIKKIEQILSYLKDSIIANFTNEEIVHMFLKNKRVLLELIYQKIIKIDLPSAKIILQYEKFYAKYQDYFFPELKPFLSQRNVKNKEQDIQKNFEELRKNGENENEICQLIRNDSIEEFIVYQNKSNIDLKSAQIISSDFETNPFLIGKDSNLIEYAAFYNSIQIFKYLQAKEVKLTPSLWMYAIHGKSDEIIQVLIDNKIKPPPLPKIDHSKDISSTRMRRFGEDETKEEEEEEIEVSYDLCLKEAFECHHNQVINFLIENFKDQISLNFLKLALKKYNFEFLQINDICKETFFMLCRYDYYIFVEALLSEKGIDINELTVFLKFFF